MVLVSAGQRIKLCGLGLIIERVSIPAQVINKFRFGSMIVRASIRL